MKHIDILANAVLYVYGSDLHLCASDGERRLEARRLWQRLPLGGALDDVQLQDVRSSALCLLQGDCST